MAFKKQKESDTLILLLTSALIVIPVLATTNIDCKGKAFHCFNSTHFKICVDFGGVSKTVDDFLIPCPPSTVCTDNNYFECEYQISTTSAAVPLQSDVTNEFSEKTASSPWELFDVTTILPVHNNEIKIGLSENSTITSFDIVSHAVGFETAEIVNYAHVNDLSEEITGSELHNTTIYDVSVSENNNSKPAVVIFNDTLTSTTITSETINYLNITSAGVTTENYSGTDSDISIGLINTIATTPSNAVTGKDADFPYTKLFSPVITDNFKKQNATVTIENYSGNAIPIGVYEPVTTIPMNNMGNGLISTPLRTPVRTDNSSTSPAIIKSAIYSGTENELSIDLYKHVNSTPMNYIENEDSTSIKLTSPEKTDDLGPNNSLTLEASKNYTVTESELTIDLFNSVITASLNNNELNKDLISTTLSSYVNESHINTENTVEGSSSDDTINLSSFTDFNLASTQQYTIVDSPTETTTNANELNAMTFTDINEFYTSVAMKTSHRLDDLSMHENGMYVNNINQTSTHTSKSDSVLREKLAIYSDTESEISIDVYKHVTSTPTNYRGYEDSSSIKSFSTGNHYDLSPSNSLTTAASINDTVTGGEISIDLFNPVIRTSLNNKENVESDKDFISTTLSSYLNESHINTENIVKGSSSDTNNLSSFSDYNLASTQQYTIVDPPTETTTNANELNAMTFTDINEFYTSVAMKTSHRLDDPSMHENGMYVNNIDQTSTHTSKTDSVLTEKLAIYSDTESEISIDVYKHVTSTPTNYRGYEDSSSIKSFSTGNHYDLSPSNSLTTAASVNDTVTGGEISIDLFNRVIRTSLNNIENVEPDKDFISTTLSSYVNESHINTENIVKGSSSDTNNLSSFSDYNLASTQQYTIVDPPTETITNANELNAYKFYTNMAKKNSHKFGDFSTHEKGTYINRSDQTPTHKSKTDSVLTELLSTTAVNIASNNTMEGFSIKEQYDLPSPSISYSNLNTETKSSSDMDLTTGPYIANKQEDTTIRNLPTTQASELYVTTLNIKEKIDSNVNITLTTMPIIALTENHPVTENIIQKSSSTTTSKVNSKETQKDTKVIVNSLTENTTYTKNVDEAKNTSNDNVDDFLIHGNGITLLSNIDFTSAANRYNELESKTDVNVAIKNTEAEFSTNEQTLPLQMVTHSNPTQESIKNKLLESTTFKSSSDIDLIITTKSYVGNVYKSTNMKNVSLPRASTIDFNGWYTNVVKKISNSTDQQLLMNENDSVNNITKDITLRNADLLSTANTYSDKINFTAAVNIALNNTKVFFSMQENNVSSSPMISESSIITENIVSKPSSDMYYSHTNSHISITTTDSHYIIANINQESKMTNVNQSMPSMNIGTLLYPTNTENVIMETSANNVDFVVPKEDSDGTQYLPIQRYNNDNNSYSVSTSSIMKSVPNYDVNTTESSINVFETIFATTIANKEPITTTYTDLSKTQEKYNPLSSTAAGKETTLSNIELLKNYSNTYKNNYFGSTEIPKYQLNISDSTHIENMEQNDNYINLISATNQLNSLNNPAKQEFSTLIATPKDKVNNEITTTENIRYGMEVSKNFTKVDISTMMLINENNSISTKAINLNITPLMYYDNNNADLTDNIYSSTSTENILNFTKNNLSENVTESSVLDSQTLEKPQILDSLSEVTIFSTLVTDTHSNSYSETKKATIYNMPQNLKIDKGSTYIISEDEFSVSTDNTLTKPSKSVVNSISRGIDKDQDNIRPTLEISLNEISSKSTVQHIFVSTDRISPLKPDLLYDKNIFAKNILKPTTLELSKRYFVRNNTTPLEIENKNTVKGTTTLTNVTEANSQITKKKIKIASIPENILRVSATQNIDFVDTAITSKINSTYGILSEIINKEKNIIKEEPRKRDSEFGGLNQQNNVEKSVLIFNQHLQNLTFNNTNTSTQLHKMKNINTSQDLYNFTNYTDTNKIISGGNTESNLYANTTTSQPLKMRREKISLNVEHNNKTENISNNNLDSTNLTANMNLISEINNQNSHKSAESRTETEGRPNSLINKSSLFYRPSLNNLTIINTTSKVMNLTDVKNNSFQMFMNKQHENLDTENKSSIFNRPQLNRKLVDSSSISPTNTYNNILKIKDHFNNVSINKNNQNVDIKLKNEDKRIEKTTDQTPMMTVNLMNRNVLKKYDTTKSKFSCNNRHRGKYSDKNDCQNFYICIGRHEPILGKCPKNTVFSEISKQCTKNLSHCIRNNQFQCISPGRYIDIFSEQFYYICAKKKEGYIRFKLKCQKGYHFNKTKLYCVLDSLNGSMSNEDSSKIDSEKSTIESKSKEDSKKKNEGRKEFNDFECKNEGKFVYQNDCRKYYQCTRNGPRKFRRKIKKCDSDEVFNNEKKKCVDEESYECKE